MLNITNLNSSKTINYQQNKIIALSGILSGKMKTVPVYLVDGQTIDKLYPQEKRKLLNEECLNEISKSKDKKITKYNFEEIFDECSRETSFEVVGLYLRNIPAWLRNKFNNLKEPAIFICPERCISWGNRLNIPADFVFTKVLFHEYAHAYLDSNGVNEYYDTSWGKIIEESLANYIACTRFKSYKDKANAMKLILDQPLEYKCSLVLIEKNNTPIYTLPLLFRGRSFSDRELHRYLHEYLYERYGISDFILVPDLYKIWKEYKKKEHNDIEIKDFFRLFAIDLVNSILK